MEDDDIVEVARETGAAPNKPILCVYHSLQNHRKEVLEHNTAPPSGHLIGIWQPTEGKLPPLIHSYILHLTSSIKVNA